MKTNFSLELLPAMTLAFVAIFAISHGAPAKSGAPTKAPPTQELHADITINPAELAPESTIEVVFPTAMVAKDQIGKSAATSPLVVIPELTGTFQWTSTRSGQFHLTQAPKFASSYEFKLRAGLTDLAGKSLAAEKLDSVNSARFRIIDQHPRWFDDDAQNRTPRFLFEFNDSVTPAEVVKHIKFVSESSPQPVAAKVRHATGKDFTRMSTEPQATWAEEISKVKPAVGDDAARLSAIIIEPETPLAIGKWRLTIGQTLSNASGINQIATGDDIQLGEIKPFEVRAVEAHTPFDSDYYIDIDFNKRLLPPSEEEMKPEEQAAFAKKLAALVHIDPIPAGETKAEVFFRTLRISGKFPLQQPQTITVDPAMTSGDGMALGSPVKKSVTFIPNPPYLAAPTFINAQLAKGTANYEFSAANVSQVRVRAKRLNGPELLKALDQYRAYRTAFYGNDKQKAAYKTQSIDTYPGTQVFDRSFPVTKPLDHSEILKLNWREVLGDFPAAPLFIELEGTAAAGLQHKGVVTQTLVQLSLIHI